MDNFIKTTDLETVNKLMALGFKLVSQTGDLYTFKNHPSLQFELESQDNLKIVKTNMLCI